MSFKSTVNLFTEAECFPVSCRICGGELYPALAPVRITGRTTASDIPCAEYSAGTGYFFLCTVAQVLACTDGGMFELITLQPGDYAFLIEDVSEGEPRAAVIKGGTAVVRSGEVFETIQNIGADLRCGVMHCGRLFGVDAADPFKLCWSGEGGFTDWSTGVYGSGYLTLDPERGEVLNLLNFGDKIVAVRKYGLTVLSMFGSTENFSVKMTNTDTDVIGRDTARVVGDSLIFCTDSGLYAYDGAGVKKLTHRYARDISEPVCAAALGGQYFLGCTSRYAGGKAVLCYDTSDGESYLINAPAVRKMCSAETVYVYGGGSVQKLQPTESFTLTCGKLDFGSGRKKTVTEIYIDGKADELELSNGKATRRFLNAEGVICPKLRGKNFTVKLTASERIRAVKITAEVCNAI